MEFENEYFGQFIADDRAYSLWIYYYYLTEEFDRNCLHTRPSPVDSDSVIPYDSSIKYSNNYANKIRNLIFEVAMSNGLSEQDMMYFKIYLSRLKYKKLEREHFEIINNGGFKFIDDYVEKFYPDGYY